MRSAAIVLLLGCSVISSVGCTMCASPHYCKYAAYGSCCPRTDMVNGRVGSVIDPAAAACTVGGVAAGQVIEGAPIEGMPLEPTPALPVESIPTPGVEGVDTVPAPTNLDSGSADDASDAVDSAIDALRDQAGTSITTPTVGPATLPASGSTATIGSAAVNLPPPSKTFEDFIQPSDLRVTSKPDLELAPPEEDVNVDEFLR